MCKCNKLLLLSLLTLLTFPLACTHQNYSGNTTPAHTDPCDKKERYMAMDHLTKREINIQLVEMRNFSPPNDKIVYYENWKKKILNIIEKRKVYLGECYQYSAFKVSVN